MWGAANFTKLTKWRFTCIYLYIYIYLYARTLHPNSRELKYVGARSAPSYTLFRYLDPCGNEIFLVRFLATKSRQ